ncbi:MAG: peptidylprolyl isomerase [Thermoplasmatota archaeon]
MRGWPWVVLVVAAGCMAAPPHLPESAARTMPAILFSTEMGNFTAVLYTHEAPRTVELMRELASSSYFQGRGFTRIVPGHVIQEADASGGLADDSRTLPLEIDPALHFSAGAMGIARGMDPNSGGPEFFVMDFATSHLDGNYTVWGQVVQGMDVVHRIARAPAVDAPRVPSLPHGPLPDESGTPIGTTDRMATPPIRITAARVTTVNLSEAAALALPLQVAHDVRVGDYRHSLEWPATLRAGSAADLTWYVRPYNGSALPGPLQISVDGATLETAPDGDAPGAYHFSWTPSRPGTHLLTASAGERILARLTVTVPA